MPIYKYFGLTKDGSKKHGVITADDKKQGVNKLYAQCISVIFISRIFFLSKISTEQELIRFFTYILFQIRCNVPILLAISSYINVSNNTTIKAMFEKLYQAISDGSSLYEAFSAEDKIFGNIIPSLLQSAEISGMLSESISNILIYLKFNETIRRKIKRAAMYPVFVFITAVVALGFCVSCLGPQIQDLIKETNNHFFITDICLAVIPDEDHFMIFIIGLSAILSSFFIISKKLLIKICLLIPVIRSILKKIYEWNCCVVLYIALKSKTDLIQAIKLMADAVQNTPFQRDFLKVLRNVENGLSLSDALTASTVMSPGVIQSLRIGEDSNQLIDALHNIVELQHTNIDYAIKKLGNKVSITITVTTGILLIIILLGLFYPLYNEIEMIK